MEETRPRIVVTESYSPAALQRLRQCGDVVELQRPDADALQAALAEAQALVIRTYTQVTEAVLAAAPRLRVIGRGGVGLDNVDVAAAHRRGIVVVHTPAAATHSVAEHTIMLMLAVERQLLLADAATRAGRFVEVRNSARFRETNGLTLGVVGMGRIGSAVARAAASGLGMTVLYNDIVEVGPFGFPARPVAKDELYAAADVVTLHVPLTRLTRGLIGREALASFRPAATLINTSRGAVVDTAALVEALQRGRIAGAGLDVYDCEPLPAGHPLLAAPRTVLTPHIASRSHRGLERMNDVVDDVAAVLEGRPPQFPAGEELD